MQPWNVSLIPDQTGQLVVVTGAGGLGYETSLALARAGARVVIAGRNEAKGGEAVDRIRAQHRGANVAFEKVDLANLSSIKVFAERFSQANTSLDLLVNNAGVMTPPKRRVTDDGFELQFGTNYLGHFALTGRLLPLLRRAKDARIVNVSSLAHRTGQIEFGDLQWTKTYPPWKAYGQSKLAMIIFARELQRRSVEGGWGVNAFAAHPGYARTELIANGPGDRRLVALLGNVLFRPWASQSAAEGALPQLFAATAPQAQPGGFYGPSRLWELVGPPAPAIVAKQAEDREVARKLWSVSETLTGVSFS